MGVCPECDSKIAASEQCLSSKMREDDPWSAVLQAFVCAECDSLVPGHLWELWGGMSADVARREWQEVYRPQMMSRAINGFHADVVPEGEGGQSTSGSISESSAVAIAEKLLAAGDLSALLQHCAAYVETYRDNPSLWKLYGVAQGNSGNAESARFSFLQALRIQPGDPIAVANYITSCFDLGDKAAGLLAIEEFFNHLDLDGQGIVLESLYEATNSGLVTRSDLPQVIQKVLAEIF